MTIIMITITQQTKQKDSLWRGRAGRGAAVALGSGGPPSSDRWLPQVFLNECFCCLKISLAASSLRAPEQIASARKMRVIRPRPLTHVCTCTYTPTQYSCRASCWARWPCPATGARLF